MSTCIDTHLSPHGRPYRASFYYAPSHTVRAKYGWNDQGFELKFKSYSSL